MHRHFRFSRPISAASYTCHRRLRRNSLSPRSRIMEPANFESNCGRRHEVLDISRTSTGRLSHRNTPRPDTVGSVPRKSDRRATEDGVGPVENRPRRFSICPATHQQAGSSASSSRSMATLKMSQAEGLGASVRLMRATRFRGSSDHRGAIPPPPQHTLQNAPVTISHTTRSDPNDSESACHARERVWPSRSLVLIWRII